jgi:DNA-binding transcriptional LysR family regulator
MALEDIAAFLAVARAGSFARAAAEMGVTPSALSHTIRRMEERLGLRLLSRTTRRVATTEAGERMLQTVGPLVARIEAEMGALAALREKPSGTIRITCTDHTIESVFRPKLAAFLSAHPEVRVELDMNYALVDIVAERFDAGVRIGETLAKDMVATRIGPDWRFSVVATPGYFRCHPAPETPKDLARHNCITLRMASAGGFLAWEFRALHGRELRVKVSGQAAFNTIGHVLEAALDGIGLAFVPQELAAPHLVSGRLVEVLTAWCPPYEGFHLYYPSRKQHSPAFAAFVDFMRYRG